MSHIDQLTDLTTLICLFHHPAHAQAALEDILEDGIPEPNITLIGLAGSQITASRSTLLELNVPEADTQRLLDGIASGGAVLTVSAISSRADQVEAIFAAHSAGKIDEAVVADDMSAEALPPFATEDVSPATLGENTGPDAYEPERDVDPRELGLDPRMHPVTPIK